MLDVAVLAKDVVAFLTPFLPYLLKAGQSAADEAGKQLGELAGGGAWEKAKALWGKLRPKIEANPPAREALEDVAAATDDEDTRAVLRQQLKKLLAEDKEFADGVAQISDEAKMAGVNLAAIGDRSVAIGRDMIGSVINFGDKNKIQQ